MLLGSALRRFPLSVLLVSLPLIAQTAERSAGLGQAQAQTSPPAPIPVEQEHHHHLVFENSYVRVFYVEIPPHEATLYHRHDLPYVSLPPPPVDNPPAASNLAPSAPRVGYMSGGLSHTVTNSRDVPLRNVAVELLRPQGSVRNRCAQVLGDQPPGDCDKRASADRSIRSHYTLFETDEISVEYWDVGTGATIRPADPQLSTLVGSLTGMAQVLAEGNSQMVPQAGLVWLPGGSQTAFQTGADAGGHFIRMVFKDSAAKP